jgi:uncharacterized membrane protein YkvA (DUF1232 family)
VIYLAAWLSLRWTEGIVDVQSLKSKKTSSLNPAEAVVRGETRLMRWSKRSIELQREAHVFYFAFKHPRMPWYARIVAACTAGYLFSPIQLIPSFIPVIGLLDDLLVLFLGLKLLRRITPPDVLIECRELAEADQMQGREESKSVIEVIAPMAIAALWVISSRSRISSRQR